MTLEEIRELVVSVDPNVRHYFSTETEHDYSYWEETHQLPFVGDDVHLDAWKFYVHRFTRSEHDPVARLFMQALDADPRVAVKHTVDYENDTGYIHHIYECEGY